MQNVPDRPIPAEQWTTAGPIGLNKIKFDLKDNFHATENRRESKEDLNNQNAILYVVCLLARSFS